MPLTQEQKELVIMYRNSGIGYRHIATMIGVKRDQVRSVCSSFGLIGLYGKQKERSYCECKICGKKYLIEDGLSKNHCSIKCKEVSVELVLKKRIKKKTFVCITCGKEFVRNGSQVYCSNKCRYEDRVCEVCGKTYKVKRDSKNVCCSTKCREIKKRKSHEEYYQEFSQIYKGRIVPITVYNGSSNDMTVYCI